MKNYNIFSLVGETYEVLITILNSDSPLECLPEFEKELLDKNVCGNVLIDQILHVGNTQERFLEIAIDKNGFRKDSINVVNIPKASILRKISCDILQKTDVLEFSILSSVQKRMINKGIAI